jgi:hypothetical protein
MPRAIRLNLKRILQVLSPPSRRAAGDPDASGAEDASAARAGGEARKRFRFDLSCEVVCEAEGRRIRGQLADISTSGARIGCGAPLPAGTRVALLIGLTEELLEFALPAEVSRSTDDGFAIQFLDLGREQYLALCEAISIASDLIEKSGEES